MTFPISSFLPLVLPVINHILAQEPWAVQQLQKHAGKVACLDFKHASVRLKISTHGFFQTALDDDKTNVTIHINPADIALILQNRERAISYIQLEGDADLAQTLSDLGKQLRLDLEHQLSQVFGDIAGRRLASSIKQMANSMQTNAQKLQENVAEYLLEENPLLVRPQKVVDLSSDIVRLRDDVERLLKRIEQCEKAFKHAE